MFLSAITLISLIAEEAGIKVCMWGGGAKVHELINEEIGINVPINITYQEKH